MSDAPADPDDAPEPDETSSDGGGRAERSARDGAPAALRWCLYPAYALAVLGGGVAARFAHEHPEWSTGPVVLAWGLLATWHWLYGVGVRYHRPLLRYISAMADVAMGGLLTAFALERAAPQLASIGGGTAIRGLSIPLVWTAVATVVSTGLILIHALVVSRFWSH